VLSSVGGVCQLVGRPSADALVGSSQGKLAATGGGSRVVGPWQRRSVCSLILPVDIGWGWNESAPAPHIRADPGIEGYMRNLMTNKVLAAGFVALPLVWSAAVVTGVTGLAGCAGQRGATQQAMARARTSQAEGSKVYSENCTICHGDVGQGGPGAPPVMGGSALPVKVRIRRDHKIDSLKADDARRKQYEDSKVAGSGEREQRMRFRTAQDIFVFVTEKHPPMSASLDPEQYWSVLSFVLDAHGLKVPAGGLNEKNAVSVENER